MVGTPGTRKTAVCTKLRVVCNKLIIKAILVEATGVELFRVLTARKLLILETATTAKKAPWPDPLYVYCTKMLFALELRAPRCDLSIPWIRRDGSRKSTQLAVIRQVTAFPFLRDARRLDYCEFVREPAAIAITSDKPTSRYLSVESRFDYFHVADHPGVIA
jgi:hypothetical protein